MDLEAQLQNHFSLPSFRLGQREIISSILEGQDVLAIMPTGGGKSLCFQLPAVMKSGITIVVSPLIALMNDQVSSLKAKGLKAGYIHSGASLQERKMVFQEMKDCVQAGVSFILYLSPERIQKPGFAAWIKNQKLALFAIDEAHCVSQWGHDFRLEYSQISILRDLRPDIPIVALTATATPQVKFDIAKYLKLNKPANHVYGFYRPNLYYQVEFCEDDIDKENFVIEALNKFDRGRIILYCGTRKKAEYWAQLLEGKFGRTGFYHAGLSPEKRVEVENQYKDGTVRILCATNAFGMGIDHHDVRLVIHTQMPGNVESYYQEIGRAGRDGEDSTCLLLYAKKDKGLHSFFIHESDATKEIKSHRWRSLDAIIQYAEGGECRHGEILTYFRDRQRIKNCGHCDCCSPSSARKVPKVSHVDKPKKKSRRKKKGVDLATELNQDARWRYDLLREWRREYAKENDIPAFIVFSDKTLRDLAMKAPESLEDMSEVYGLGEKKIEVYGKILLEKLHP